LAINEVINDLELFSTKLLIMMVASLEKLDYLQKVEKAKIIIRYLQENPN